MSTQTILAQADNFYFYLFKGGTKGKNLKNLPNIADFWGFPFGSPFETIK